MTEMQPTEIELTSKRKKPVTVSRRRFLAYLLTIIAIAALALFMTFFAYRASETPELIQDPLQGQIIPE